MSQTLISDLHQYAAQLYWPQAEDIEACDFETLLFEDSHSPGHEIIQLFSAYPPPSESQELRGVGPLGPASEFDLLSLARNHLRNHGVKEERLTRLASFVVPELAVLVLQKLRGGSRIDIINMVEDRHAQLFGRMIRPLSLSVAKSEKDSRRCRELEEHTSRVGLEASQRIQVAERSADKARADSASLLARLQQEYEEAGKAAVDAERMRLQQYYEEAGKTAVDAERTRLQQEYEEASQTAVDAERARLQQEYEEAAKAAVDAERARLQQQHEQEKRRLQEAHRNAIEEISARIRKELTTIDSTTEAWKETSSDRAVNRIPGIAQPVIHHSSWEPPPTWRTHDRYQYLRRIGGGSQGDVWLCEDLIHRRNVVVKASRCELHGIPPNTMLREINALRKSIHHNIVYLTDVLYSTTAVGIVLPACATDLRCVLSQSRPSLDAALGKYYLRQILSGLDFLHRKRRLLHLDLKPDNILLSEDHRLRLADFGLSRPPGPTGAQRTVITCEYRPPEVFFRTDELTEAADIWSVGVIVQEMIGPFPWRAYHHSPMETFKILMSHCGSSVPLETSITSSSMREVAHEPFPGKDAHGDLRGDYLLSAVSAASPRPFQRRRSPFRCCGGDVAELPHISA